MPLGRYVTPSSTSDQEATMSEPDNEDRDETSENEAQPMPVADRDAVAKADDDSGPDGGEEDVQSRNRDKNAEGLHLNTEEI